MDSEYFKEQILDELEGAKDYIKKSIEIKAMNEQWSDKYAEMSVQETGHAKNLYDMFKEYISIQKKAYDGVLPSYIQKNWDCVSGCYEKCMSDIKELQSVMLGGE